MEEVLGFIDKITSLIFSGFGIIGIVIFSGLYLLAIYEFGKWAIEDSLSFFLISTGFILCILILFGVPLFLSIHYEGLPEYLLIASFLASWWMGFKVLDIMGALENKLKRRGGSENEL